MTTINQESVTVAAVSRQDFHRSIQKQFHEFVHQHKITFELEGDYVPEAVDEYILRIVAEFQEFQRKSFRDEDIITLTEDYLVELNDLIRYQIGRTYSQYAKSAFIQWVMGNPSNVKSQLVSLLIGIPKNADHEYPVNTPLLVQWLENHIATCTKILDTLKTAEDAVSAYYEVGQVNGTGLRPGLSYDKNSRVIITGSGSSVYQYFMNQIQDMIEKAKSSKCST